MFKHFSHICSLFDAVSDPSAGEIVVVPVARISTSLIVIHSVLLLSMKTHSTGGDVIFRFRGKVALLANLVVGVDLKLKLADSFSVVVYVIVFSTVEDVLEDGFSGFNLGSRENPCDGE